jgi:hypothetical protein
MAPTPPNQSAGQSQAQPFAQDQRVTNGLRWIAAVSGSLCVLILTTLASDFKQTRDNQLKLGIIVDNLSVRLARVENDKDKQDDSYRKVLERQQMQHLAIQQIQSHLRLR